MYLKQEEEREQIKLNLSDNLISLYKIKLLAHNIDKKLNGAL